jgi:hypothetical protein
MLPPNADPTLPADPTVTPEPPATPPAGGEPPAGGDDWRDKIEERMTGLEQSQRDMLEAQRSNTDALSQVSTSLATLNERLANPPPAPGPEPRPGRQTAPPAIQPVPAPAPVPGPVAEPAARKRRYV